MIWLLLFSFFSGFGTLLAPCIWPVIPLILSPEVVGKDHRKSMGIVTGIVVSFWLFTFFVSLYFQIFHVNTSISKDISAVVTAFFGIMLIIPGVMRHTNDYIQRFAKAIDIRIEYKKSLFTDGVITGVFLGLIWSPSAGPIIATISSLASREQIFIDVLLISLCFVFGFGIPLFIISYLGQRFFRQKKVSPHALLIQRIIGTAMLISAVLLFTNLDVFVSHQALRLFPQLQPLFAVFSTKPVLPK